MNHHVNGGLIFIQARRSELFAVGKTDLNLNKALPPRGAASPQIRGVYAQRTPFIMYNP